MENIIQKAIASNSTVIILDRLKLDNLTDVLNKLHDVENLEELILKQNNFSGTLNLEDFNKFPNLNSLDISYNSFTKVIGKTNLEKLVISNNNIKEQNIESDSLQKLDISENSLFTTDFSKLKNCIYLCCSRNNLTRIPKLPEIMTLKISHNLITNITDLPIYIKYLDCSNNKLNNFSAKIHNCKYFDVSFNLLKELSLNCSNILKCLNVSFNELVKFKIPSSVEIFQGTNNMLNEIIFDGIELISVNLTDNKLTAKPKFKVRHNITLNGNPIQKTDEERFPGHGYTLSHGSAMQITPMALPPPPSYNHNVPHNNHITYNHNVPHNNHTAYNLHQKPPDYKPMFSTGRYSKLNPNYVVLDMSKVVTI